MSALWLLPALITLFGLIPVIFAVREATEEAEQTMRELGRFGGMRPALVELRSEIDAVRDAARTLGRR
jgi:hypothetical protein